MSRLLCLLFLLTAAGAPHAQTDRDAVRGAVLDYANALYDADPALVDRSVSGDLVKVGVFPGEDGPTRGEPMTFDALRRLAATWNADGQRVASGASPARVTVLDVLERTASARLEAVWGVDHVHLAREADGAWRIVQILWQEPPAAPSATEAQDLVVSASDTEDRDGLTVLRATGEPVTGTVVERHPNGTHKLRRTLVGGRADGLWVEWYPNGTVRYIGEWAGGRGDGVWTYFHETGEIRERSEVTDDVWHGRSEGWHANGQRAFSGRYEWGAKAPGWQRWDEDGRPVVEQERPTPEASGEAAEPAWRPFAPGIVSLPGIGETSPTVTADGRTLLFARTTGWERKVPHLAAWDGERWQVERATFADTLYNAAISPDGGTVLFQTHEASGDSLVSRVYRSVRDGAGWSVPEALPTLSGLDAGYVCILPDGTLYVFAWQPRGGIYRVAPDGTGYGAPVWIGDAVSPEGTTSFDALVHPGEDRLILSRFVPDDLREAHGESGFYLYRRMDGVWTEDRRLDLPSGWGATVLPDGRFLFVHEG
ncbi:MAG: nuclear transport factor 2 family protein, partial [Bacteroidota bacterium]